MNIEISWEKVVGFKEICKHHKFMKNRGGVYLWLIGTGKKRVCYVGQAKVFWKRFIDHLSNTITGQSTCFYPGSEDFVEFMKNNYSNKKYEDLHFDAKDKFYMTTIHRFSDSHDVCNSFKESFFDIDAIKRRIDYMDNLEVAFGDMTESNKPEDFVTAESILILKLRDKYGNGKDIKLKKSEKQDFKGIRTNNFLGCISKYPPKGKEINVKHYYGDNGIKSRIPEEVKEIDVYYCE